METSRIVGAGAIARPRADVGIGPYARKKGTDVPLRRKLRIRAGRPRKKMSFSDRLCLTQPVRDDILLVVFKDSRGLRAINILPRMQPIPLFCAVFVLARKQCSFLRKRPQDGALPIHNPEVKTNA